MAKITFIEHDGESRTVDAEPGQSIMRAATGGGVAGIAADCGGNAACGTCRIYVGADWLAKLPSIRDTEREMLDFTADPTPGTRLSCQIVVTEELDGMVVNLPESQH